MMRFPMRCRFVMKLSLINQVLFSIMVVWLVSCNDSGNEVSEGNPSEVEDSSSQTKVNLPVDVDSVVVDSTLSTGNSETQGIVYKKDRIVLDNITFPKFQHPAIPRIMAGMKMCQMEQDTTQVEGKRLPPCDHNLYRAFKIRKGSQWADGFILEVKASVYSYTRMVIVVKKIGGKYTAVNQFSGKLIELDLEKDQTYSMLIGYADASVGSIAIRHEFDKNKYVPVVVEEINNRFVKDAYKDSLYDVYIKDFAWGY